MAEIKTGRLISACMMVRDEEKNLGRCLESIKDFVDEIIVVDTGSKDKTIEIAQKYGAKIFEHPWQNDFSLHRNQSIGYASCEWLLIIDADEQLSFEGRSPSEIRNALAKINKDQKSLAITLRDRQGGHTTLEFNSARFFRNGSIKYQGIVHNQPVIKDGTGAFILPYVVMNHYGYDLSPEGKKKKFERTAGLLKKTLEKNPEDYHSFFYLCQLYTVHGDLKAANEWGEKYLQHKDELDGSGVGNFNPTIYYTMAKNAMRLKDQTRCSELITEGLREIPGDLDLALVLTEYGVMSKRSDLVFLGAKQFVNAYKLFKENHGLRKSRFIFNNTPESLAYCLYQLTVSQLEEVIKGIKDISKVLKETPESFREGMMRDLKIDLEEKGFGQIFEAHVNPQDLGADFFKKIEVSCPEAFLPYQPSKLNGGMNHVSNTL